MSHIYVLVRGHRVGPTSIGHDVIGAYQNMESAQQAAAAWQGHLGFVRSVEWTEIMRVEIGADPGLQETLDCPAA